MTVFVAALDKAKLLRTVIMIHALWVYCIHHGLATSACRMDMQNGHAEWTCSMVMKMHHGHGHIAKTWTCSTAIGMQLRHWHAAQTCTCSSDMDMQRAMDMQHGHRHAARTWKCTTYMDIQYLCTWTWSMYMEMQHRQGHAALKWH